MAGLAGGRGRDDRLNSARRLRLRGPQQPRPEGAALDRAASALDKRHVDRMLRDEPDLELVAAKDVAHQEVVRGPVRALLRGLDGGPDLLDDGLMRIERAMGRRRD